MTNYSKLNYLYFTLYNLTKFLLVWSSLYSYSQDPEQAVEVEEELALDDRKLPLAYNYPRHQEEICGEETESQVMVWNKQPEIEQGINYTVTNTLFEVIHLIYVLGMAYARENENS